MNIDKYIAQFNPLIASYSHFIESHELNIEKRAKGFAYIHGFLKFIDGSVLDFKEFIEGNTRRTVKYKYGYNYRRNTKILFRYDNANDPKARLLKSFPHHKHLENGDIIESSPVALKDVLREIEILLLRNLS